MCNPHGTFRAVPGTSGSPAGILSPQPHRSRRSSAFILLLLGTVVFCQARQQLASAGGNVGSRLDAYLSRAAAFGYSGTVLVIKHGQIILQRGYGLADRSKGIPFTPETAFDIGSVTKQFTAAAVLKLEMGEKLKTSDRIEKYLDGVPSDKADITVHHLLTHTSGLQRDYGNKSEIFSRDQMIKGILSTPLTSNPGEKYSYSNAGYVLLAAIIEKVTRQSYYAFMHEALFGPLGMSKTGFYNESERWTKDQVAHAYFETAEEGVPTAWPLTWSATGNGHVITTMTDLYKWEMSLRDTSLLSGQETRNLFTPFAQVEESTSYGYGWFIKTHTLQRLYFHPGFYRSFGAEYRRYPDNDLAVIVTSNQGFLDGNGMQVPICQPVAEIALGGTPRELPPVISLTRDSLRRFEGSYRLTSGGQFTIFLQGDALKIEMTGQDAFDAIYCDSSSHSGMTSLNRQAALMIDATKKGDRKILTEALSKLDYAAYAPVMDPGWSTLAKRFGTLESFDILGTAPYPFTEEYKRTYARLNFKHKHVIVTFGYRNGVFLDLSTWEDVPNPGALPLAPVCKNEFATFNLWTSRTARFSFDTSVDGRVVQLHVFSSNRQLPAKRID